METEVLSSLPETKDGRAWGPSPTTSHTILTKKGQGNNNAHFADEETERILFLLNYFSRIKEGSSTEPRMEFRPL